MASALSIKLRGILNFTKEYDRLAGGCIAYEELGKHMEITSTTAFIDYFEKIRARTRHVIECIPPDKVEWTHQPNKFTLGDLIRHLGATERYMFAENVIGGVCRYPGCGRELADGHEQTLAYLDACHNESIDVFSGLSDEDLREKCDTPGGASITVWKWLRAMIEHEIHHRGQIYMMLGILGVETPPLYGLTAEQVLDRSQGML